MKFSTLAAVCLQLSAGLAAPLVSRDVGDIQLRHDGGREDARSAGARAGAEAGGPAGGPAGGAAGGKAGGKAGAEAGGKAGAGAGGKAGAEAGGAAGGEGEGEAKENELEIQGAFGEAVTLQGGNIKQDTLYPPGTNGGFEVEFQNAAGNILTVTENAAPAPPPAGFEALEPVSYVVQLADAPANATLQKIDYILTAGNALDISKGKVGKLDAATNTFVIDETIGELEFEAEENELTLTVADLNGEWSVFVPAAAAGGGAGGNAGGEAGAEAGGAAPTTGNSILDSVLKLIGEGAATADKAAAAGKAAA